jgi:hypothetical protein
MRIAMLLAAMSALAAIVPPAAAADGGVFADTRPLVLAHEERRDHDHDEEDERMTREEIRERKRELRQRERELREQERQEQLERERRRPMLPRFWVGAGAGGGWATVDVPCPGGSTSDYDCTEEGQLATYSANVTLAGPYTAVRVRGVRQQDKGRDSRTPYEEAVMVGSRFGRSNWYGFVGAGRIQHADDEFEGDTHGFAWEIVFAPESHTALGFELSFQGEAGEDVDFFAANIGARFGLLR